MILYYVKKGLETQKRLIILGGSSEQTGSPITQLSVRRFQDTKTIRKTRKMKTSETRRRTSVGLISGQSLFTVAYHSTSSVFRVSWVMGYPSSTDP